MNLSQQLVEENLELFRDLSEEEETMLLEKLVELYFAMTEDDLSSEDETETPPKTTSVPKKREKTKNLPSKIKKQNKTILMQPKAIDSSIKISATFPKQRTKHDVTTGLFVSQKNLLPTSSSSSKRLSTPSISVVPLSKQTVPTGIFSNWFKNKKPNPISLV